ncbi:hypothetical protein MBLNU230_g7577t1 [Neophaeotheca triangularis]
MAAADVQQPPAEPAPAVPDYLASPNAVFTDQGVQWRYGKAPDYSKTRKVWEEGKKMSHAAGSLPQLVENLVKNWEVEASFKPRLEDWRTIDHKNYTFAINGGPPQSAEHMLKVGTYNAIIAPNEYYSPENSDFASSHKTFKRMMPTFAWEVLEVYSGPPKVAFKWRHWGVMKNDYVGFNDKGEKVTAKAHGGPIDIEGVTVASVDEAVRLQSVETWFDPLEMFRQIAPHGVVNKNAVPKDLNPSDALEVSAELATNDGVKIAQAHNEGQQSSGDAPAHEHISNSTGQPADAFVPHQGADTSPESLAAGAAGACPFLSAQSGGTANGVVNTATTQGADAPLSHPEPNSGSDAGSSDWEKVSHPVTHQPAAEGVERSMYSSAVTGNEENVLAATGEQNPYKDEQREVRDGLDTHLEKSSEVVHPHPHDAEKAAHPEAGDAVVATAGSDETRKTHEEMSNIKPEESQKMMNVE